MRRGTEPAYFLGRMLQLIRTGNGKRSMSSVAQKMGASTATYQQIETGARALKENRISDLANALEMSENDLRELWWLSQGMIPTRGRGPRKFYDDRDDLKNRIHRILSRYTKESIEVPHNLKVEPVVRRRGTSITAKTLESLISQLSGQERSRVRGYIEAILELRGEE